MPLISDQDKKRLKDDFNKTLKNEVILYVFSSDQDCQYCDQTVRIAKELQETSDLIKVKKLGLDSDEAQKWGIDMVPTTVVSSSGGTEEARVKYIGIPMGYEFSSLVEDIRRISRNDPELDAETLKKLDRVDRAIRIQVFVTSDCPYCPKAVRNAHRFALANRNIMGEMIEATEFPSLAEKWGVYTVPHVVINEDIQFAGDYSDENFLDYVLEAYKKTTGVN